MRSDWLLITLMNISTGVDGYGPQLVDGYGPQLELMAMALNWS